MRTRVIFRAAEDGVRREGDMVCGMVPPGVAAPGVEADDALKLPPILRVSRFGGGDCWLMIARLAQSSETQPG